MTIGRARVTSQADCAALFFPGRDLVNDVPSANTQGMSEPIERRFAWSNMFVAPEDDPRGALDCHDERSTLTSYLSDYRLTLELKCAGLDARAMAARSVPPSTLSLLGLVRHLADVEHYWFRQVVAGEEAPPPFQANGDGDTAFDEAAADPELVAEAWAAWREEVAYADRLVAEAPDLGAEFGYAQGEKDRGTISLRLLLVHMIEEYARHCGHADLIRERIDGRVGQ